MDAWHGPVALKSNYNDKYLRYIHECGEVHSFLQFSGDEAVSPYTLYKLEIAKCGNPNLVNIRCCYNNKYWVRRSNNQYWIVAGANEPQEDTSLWSCTLFELKHVDNGGDHPLKFRHVQLGNYVYLSLLKNPFTSCLCAEPPPPDIDLRDVVTVVHLTTLPKRIALKGDNKKYLSTQAYPNLQFASDDIEDPTVMYEVFTTSDGSVRIKSDFIGKFWRRDHPLVDSNWILVDSKDTTDNDLDTFFWPHKLENNVVALKNLGNNLYCERLTAGGKIDCYSATASTITTETCLTVEEVVISRNVYNVKFQLMDARIYSQKDITVFRREVTNRSRDTIKVYVELPYTETRNWTWSSNVSLKLGVQTTIKSSIPLIITEGHIEISGEFNAGYQWGKPVSVTITAEKVYKVDVPPMTTVRVSLLATEGSCDIPFSYSQLDKLTDGQKVTYDMEDGIYTGVNYFNFKYHIDTEQLKL